MERKKVILLEALIGAAIGARSVHWKLSSIPFFTPDRALLQHRALLIAGVAAWVVFGTYWEIAAKNAAAAKSSESKGSRGIHVFLANVAVLMEMAPVRGLGRALPVSPQLMAAGLALEIAGLLLAVWARRHLGRYWSGEITIKVDHELIRSGPYTLLRHPIYTGLLTMYVGLAVLTGEWLAAIGLAVAVIAYWRKIRLEESNLRMAFGGEYEAYRRNSWALVPGVY